jgi:transcriptional regulator with XRE-family HTH domain
MKIQNIGNILKERREFFRLRQEDLSEMSGVGIKTIHLIEKGEGNPSIHTLVKLLTILGMELEIKIKTTD